MSVAVVGAGVVGLSTAINILQQVPGVHVTVIADKFENETTSIGAGGLFRPNAKHAPGTPAHLIKRWSEKSWKFYSRLAQSDLSSVSGNCVTSGYIFSHTKPEKALYEDIVYSFRELSESELANLGMQHYKFGYAVTSIVTNMQRYLPWLMDRFMEYGGRVIKKKLLTLEELIDHYDVVVNCAALGNREFGDKHVYPVRGQLVRVAAPWIKHWVYTDDGAYFIPNADFVSLGGVRQQGNDSLDVNNADTVGILERCYTLWPALKNNLGQNRQELTRALQEEWQQIQQMSHRRLIRSVRRRCQAVIKGAKIIDEWVGLRPTRSPMKLEKEIMEFPSGNLKVVQNYGHGANGVTLSWGTATEAAQMVKEMLYIRPQAKL